MCVRVRRRKESKPVSDAIAYHYAARFPVYLLYPRGQVLRAFRRRRHRQHNSQKRWARKTVGYK